MNRLVLSLASVVFALTLCSCAVPEVLLPGAAPEGSDQSSTEQSSSTASSAESQGADSSAQSGNSESSGGAQESSGSQSAGKSQGTGDSSSTGGSQESSSTQSAGESQATGGQQGTSSSSSSNGGGAALLKQILDTLNNDVYRATYELLSNGEVIYEGYEGDAAWGLQQTLADLTFDVEVNGYADYATFEALNQLLMFCGMEPVEAVDANVYAQILPLLLIYWNEPAASDLLRSRLPSSGNANMYDYLKGCVLYIKENFYSAREAFENSHYADYEERAASCVQPWPDYGELWHNDYLYSDEMSLTFEINSPDESQGMYFEVYTEEGDLASALFVTGSGSVTTWLPGGVYRIRDATGYEWYGMNEAFGRYGHYEFMSFWEFEDDAYKTYLESGYGWVISVNVETGEGSGVGTTPTDWSSWAA